MRNYRTFYSIEKKNCKELEETKKPKLKTGFNALRYEELKVAILKWMNLGNNPKETDTKMLGEYLRQLATDREIDKLHTIVKFMYR